MFFHCFSGRPKMIMIASWMYAAASMPNAPDRNPERIPTGMSQR